MDCDDDYQSQAPPVQTNFTTKATDQPQSQHPRTIPTSRGAATLSPLSSSLRAPELPDLDANIDPDLRVPVAASTSGPSKAPHLSHPGAPVVQTPQAQADSRPRQQSQSRTSRTPGCRCRVSTIAKRTRSAERPPHWRSNSRPEPHASHLCARSANLLIQHPPNRLTRPHHRHPHPRHSDPQPRLCDPPAGSRVSRVLRSRLPLRRRSASPLRQPRRLRTFAPWSCPMQRIRRHRRHHLRL
ncbi:hypothetical protein EDB89DRAFT_1458452 [Lactarius sanguifluus]|nr:hypothetical protein EDB89DRAFT_1458452 [Lactarius sanguifluus]